MRPVSATETDLRPETTDTDGDHDRFSHYVRKEDIMRANIEGVPVMALCGKVWIPNRDPQKYPVCKTCEEIMQIIRKKKKRS